MTRQTEVTVQVADLETVFVSSPGTSTSDLYAARDRLRAAIPKPLIPEREPTDGQIAAVTDDRLTVVLAVLAVCVLVLLSLIIYLAFQC